MVLGSIKTKFVFCVLAIYLGIGSVTLVGFLHVSTRIINDFALRFARKEALLEKNKTIALLDREVILARKMADDITIKNWVTMPNDRERKRLAFEELESYRRLYRDKSYFVASLSASGTYVNCNKGEIRTSRLRPDDPADKWFFEGLGNIHDVSLNLDYNATIRETKVWINAVMKGRQGTPIGICGGGITLTDFLKEIVYSSDQGLSTILIDRSGIIEAHKDRTIIEHNATARYDDKKITIYGIVDDPQTREHLRQAVTDLANGNREVVAFPAIVSGKPYLAAVSMLPGIGWYNVVLVNVSHVITMTEFLPIAAIIFLSLLMVIATIGYLTNRLILAPLSLLKKGAQEVAAGRYDVVLPVTKNDELGDLAVIFNTMTRKIMDSTSNLEAKVHERTEELSKSNTLLEESQHRIMESIRYARIIQASILPAPEALSRCLDDHFVFYRPKEIVGGDMYYLREFSAHFLVMVIDCTGHGVPGSLMTMTVHSVLNHVVDDVCNDDPSRILAELNRILQQTLRFDEVESGLDIGLCMVDSPNDRLLFAGAGLSLFVVAGKEVIEIKGNHQRLGYKRSRLEFIYENHELKLSSLNACYLATDGLFDEPGGEKGYGFGTPRFKALLADHASETMAEQVDTLARALDRYRGNFGQRDDITVIGFRSANRGAVRR